MIPLPPVISAMMTSLAEFDEDRYVGCFADEFVCREPVTGVTTVHAEMRQHVSVSRQNWSSFETVMTDVVGGGNAWALEYTCVLMGGGNGFEGVRVDLECNAVVTLDDDGLITEWHEQYDTGVLRAARVAASRG